MRKSSVNMFSLQPLESIHALEDVILRVDIGISKIVRKMQSYLKMYIT